MRGTPSAALAMTTSMKGNLQMITSFHSHRAIRSKNGFSIWGFYASWAENDLTCSNCVSVRYTMSHTTEIVLSWNRFWFLFWKYEMSTFIPILSRRLGLFSRFFVDHKVFSVCITCMSDTNSVSSESLEPYLNYSRLQDDVEKVC